MRSSAAFALAAALVVAATGTAADPPDRVVVLLAPAAKDYAPPVADELAKRREIVVPWFITRTGPAGPPNGPPTFDAPAVDVRVGDTLKGVDGWKYAVRLGPPRPDPRSPRWYLVDYAVAVRGPDPKAAPVDVAKGPGQIQLGPTEDLTAGYASWVARLVPYSGRQWGPKLLVARPVEDGLGHQYWPIEMVKRKAGVQPTVKFHNRLPCPVALELTLHTRPTDVNLPPTGRALDDQLFVLAPGEKREVVLTSAANPFPYGWVSPRRLLIVDDTLASAKNN